MKFTRNKTMSFIAVLVILVIYNVIAFVLPFDRQPGFWVGYIFSMLSILLTTGVGFYSLSRKGLKSKFYGIPLIFVVWHYLIIQLVFGFLEMMLQIIPFQYGIAINVILLGACLIGLIAVNISKEEIERIDEKIKKKVFYIKSLQSDIEALIDKTSDESAKKLLKELVETIQYSDPMSSPQLEAIESEINTKVTVLIGTVSTADTNFIRISCNELQGLFSERNQKCKILK